MLWRVSSNGASAGTRCTALSLNAGQVRGSTCVTPYENMTLTHGAARDIVEDAPNPFNPVVMFGFHQA
jgi:hypothetical protein